MKDERKRKLVWTYDTEAVKVVVTSLPEKCEIYNRKGEKISK